MAKLYPFELVEMSCVCMLDFEGAMLSDFCQFTQHIHYLSEKAKSNDFDLFHTCQNMTAQCGSWLISKGLRPSQLVTRNSP